MTTYFYSVSVVCKFSYQGEQQVAQHFLCKQNLGPLGEDFSMFFTSHGSR